MIGEKNKMEIAFSQNKTESEQPFAPLKKEKGKKRPGRQNDNLFPADEARRNDAIDGNQKNLCDLLRDRENRPLVQCW